MIRLVLQIGSKSFGQSFWIAETRLWCFANSKIGGTNSNHDTEGNWGDTKKEVCGTTGLTAVLAVQIVVQ